MTAWFKIITQPGEFAKNVLMLMTGALVGQAVSFIIAPILTRLYSPEDFGTAALYTSIVAISSILSTFRYDLAILLPAKGERAAVLLVLSIAITFFISSFCQIIVLLWNRPITILLGNPKFSLWLYLVPLGIFLAGSYGAISYWANREREYKKITVAGIYASLTGAGSNLGMGFAGTGALGLIASSLLAQTVATIRLGRLALRGIRKYKQSITFHNLFACAKRYQRFPLYTLPAELINMTAQQLPILMMTPFFGPSVVGFFALTQRVLAIPFSILGQSILGVFRERASSDYAQAGECKDIFIKTLKGLLATSLLPFLVLILTAPWLFTIVFGERWKEAGEYAQILAPMFFLRFTSSPLSYVIFIAEKQKYDFYGQILLLAATAASVTAGWLLKSPKVSIILYSLSYSTFYIIYLYVSYALSKGNGSGGSIS